MTIYSFDIIIVIPIPNSVKKMKSTCQKNAVQDVAQLPSTCPSNTLKNMKIDVMIINQLRILSCLVGKKQF